MPTSSLSSGLRRLLKPLRQVRYDVARVMSGRDAAAGGAKRILLGTHDLSLSGAPRLVLEMALILQRAGYDCRITSLRDGPMRSEFRDAGLPVVIETLADRRSGRLAREASGAAAAIVNTVAAAPLAQGWGASTAVLWYLHEVGLLHDMARQPAIAAALREVEALWAGSRLCADQIADIRPDTAIVPYGVPALAAPPLPDDGDRLLRIGIFGSIERRKGQDLALAAFANLESGIAQRLELHLFGRVLEADVAKEVDALVSRNPAVRYWGELTPESYRARMAEMDAVLIPSREDTLPLVSLDALSAGKVLLTTRCVGTSAFVRDGVDAIIEASADEASIGRLFARLDANRAALAAIGAKARESFAEHFSQDAFAERVLGQIRALEKAA